MKAIVIEKQDGGGTLQLSEIPEPLAGPDDLLIRVHAAGLNRADILQRKGGYPQPGPKSAYDVPGLEYAGEVVRIGGRVEGFQPGDRVMGLLPGQGYAEYVSVPARLAMHVPENLSWNEAGAVPEVYITAHDALRQCNLMTGESVLIHAAGSGVGVAAIQIARAMGASFVAGTAGSDEKLQQAAALGLDLGINYRTQDFAVEVLSATAGRGVDVVLDSVGAAYFEPNLRALTPLGRMIIIGLMSGAKVEADLGLILSRRLQIRGTTLRARPLEDKAAATRAFEKSVLPYLASGHIRVPVDRTFPLSEARAAHAYMEANANFGKVVLEVA